MSNKSTPVFYVKFMLSPAIWLLKNKTDYFQDISDQVEIFPPRVLEKIRSIMETFEFYT